MNEEPQPLTLATLGDGAAMELFQEELQKVLDNIVDPNSVAKAPREITLKVKIQPNEDRDFGMVSVSCVSKLAPLSAFSTNFYIGKHRGRGVAQEHNPKQAKLFPDDEGLRVYPGKETRHD